MTPFELDILLHYFACADDHPVVHRNPPIWPETRDAFIAEDLMADNLPDSGRTATYRLTERGRAYIEFVLAVPLPVNTWQLPQPNMLAGIRFPERCSGDLQK